MSRTGSPNTRSRAAVGSDDREKKRRTYTPADPSAGPTNRVRFVWPNHDSGVRVRHGRCFKRDRGEHTSSDADHDHRQLDGVLVADASSATLGDVAACYLGAGPSIANAPQLHYGLHPRASDALRAVGLGVDRITQTIGNAPASAGTHAQDGTADGLAYSAATDLSVRGWTEAQIKDVLERLGQVGFAAWYRKPGYDGWPSTASAHIHAVYAGCRMKLVLRDQVRDWLQDRNGLVSHTKYNFLDWSEFARNRVRKLFLAENPGLD